jgi:RNA polymerase sigma factor (sigma-70 family)
MAIPRLEALEDRTVTTTMMLEAPGLMPIPEDVPAGRFREVIATDPAGPLSSAGLMRLLGDVRKAQTSFDAMMSADGGVTMQMRLTTSSLLDEPVHTFGQSPPSGGPPPVTMAQTAVAPALPPVTPQAAASTLEAEPAETAVAQRPERPTARPEPRRAARPVPATGLESNGVQNAATGLATTATPSTPRTIQEPTQQFVTIPGVARPALPAVEATRLESSEALPQARPAVPADGPALRAEAQRFLADLPDGSLLHRFVAHREEAAFTVLVQRHERIVLGVCQRVLGDTHAAQGALQGTFLILARKASRLDLRNPLTGWLYKVAYHLALRLRAVAARQRRYEQHAANGRAGQDAESISDLEDRELRQALSEELQRLPEKYRTPLILCYFDGCTHDEAARTIGMPRGSMAKRIGEGLERLRERLNERGFIF